MIVRPAQVAGKLYPADADDLITDISQNLLYFPVGNTFPYALVVPHGDMTRCGLSSAAAFRHLSKYYPYINNVIIIGCASVGSIGASLPICDEYSTPLGRVKVAQRYMQSLALFPFVHKSDKEHFKSTAIETQLPYLQTCLAEFQILPILIGEMSLLDINSLLASLPLNRKTLTVLALDIDRNEQRCFDHREQQLFNSYLSYIKSENRHLINAEQLGVQNGLNCVNLNYQSYIVH